MTPGRQLRNSLQSPLISEQEGHPTRTQGAAYPPLPPSPFNRLGHYRESASRHYRVDAHASPQSVGEFPTRAGWVSEYRPPLIRRGEDSGSRTSTLTELKSTERRRERGGCQRLPPEPDAQNGSIRAAQLAPCPSLPPKPAAERDTVLENLEIARLSSQLEDGESEDCKRNSQGEARPEQNQAGEKSQGAKPVGGEEEDAPLADHHD